MAGSTRRCGWGVTVTDESTSRPRRPHHDVAGHGVTALLLAVLLVACSPPSSPPSSPASTATRGHDGSSPTPGESATGSRPPAADAPGPAADQLRPIGAPYATTSDPSGNHLVAGVLDVGAGPVELDAGDATDWVVTAPVVAGRLVVAVGDGSARAWVVGERISALGAEEIAALGPPPTEARPVLVHDGAGGGWRFAPERADAGDPVHPALGGVARSNADDAPATSLGRRGDDDPLLTDLLPDTRLAGDHDRVVALAGPSDAYGHAVLGDGIEATRVVAAAPDGSTSVLLDTTTVEGALVIEGLGAVVGELTEERREATLVTLSDPRDGARQAAVVDGRIALGPPIGAGNRWRHLIGVDRGEIVEVVMPHLARVAQWLQLVDGELVVVASHPDTIASHQIWSRSLDDAVLVDTDGDGRAELLGPASRRRDLLRVVDRDRGAVDDVELTGGIDSNIAGWTDGGGRAVLVTATDDGTVHVVGHGG